LHSQADLDRMNASFNVPLNFLDGKKWALHSFADNPESAENQAVIETRMPKQSCRFRSLQAAAGDTNAWLMGDLERVVTLRKTKLLFPSEGNWRYKIEVSDSRSDCPTDRPLQLSSHNSHSFPRRSSTRLNQWSSGQSYHHSDIVGLFDVMELTECKEGIAEECSLSAC
jgi:hypothetical protein